MNTQIDKDKYNKICLYILTNRNGKYLTDFFLLKAVIHA